jgi:formylmethanofuran dehydrogenase subunit C
MHGLNGATLVIMGDAGDRVGDAMRRGLILVRGEAGHFAGSGMISGTIVAQDLGDHPGYGMRRGTILAGRCGAILPTFVDTGEHQLVMLRLLRRALEAIEPGLASMVPERARRLSGDMATIGKGELLLPV